MVNDPVLNVHKDDKAKDAFNAKIGHNLSLVVEMVVKIGEIFYVNYQ